MRIPALGLFLLASLLVPSVYAQSTHEQILVPFDSAIFETASGRWLAELWVRNDGAQPVNLFPEQCTFIGRVSPCPLRIDIPACTSGFTRQSWYRRPSVCACMRSPQAG